MAGGTHSAVRMSVATMMLLVLVSVVMYSRSLIRSSADGNLPPAIATRELAWSDGSRISFQTTASHRRGTSDLVSQQPIQITSVASSVVYGDVTEILRDHAAIDGAFYNVSVRVDGGLPDAVAHLSQLHRATDDSDRPELPGPVPFVSSVEWRGKCWYELKNFCVVNGQLTLYHDPKQSPTAHKHTLRACNEFSQHSNTIRIPYYSEPLPAVLPGPLYTKTKGWILQFWCQDLFHMTLSLMPAFHTTFAIGPHPDVFIRIAKGLRKHKSQYCRIKFGDPANWEIVRNKKWGGDNQFPFAGNPYWPFYQLITPDPYRLYPLYKGATKKTTCYTDGVIDKLYLKDTVGSQARNYSNSMLEALQVVRGAQRQCRQYRLTLIDRRGRTRRLTNIPQLVEIARGKGFKAQSVALETLPIREQLALITSSDVLMGMHGNGMTWLQFLPPGSAVVELIGVWYTPYALLWGHKHFHSSMKNNMDFKRGGEFVPFAHNETEVSRLLDDVLVYLDSTSCAETPYVPPNEKLENLYKSCVPHC